MQFAKRLQPLQANVFADMDQAKAKAKASGQDIIDLSLGSSDLPASEHVLAAMRQSLSDNSTHGYLLFHGTQAFRQAAADWYTQKFGISVNPETEVLSLIGSQEGDRSFTSSGTEPRRFCTTARPWIPFSCGWCLSCQWSDLPNAPTSRKQILASI